MDGLFHLQIETKGEVWIAHISPSFTGLPLCTQHPFGTQHPAPARRSHHSSPGAAPAGSWSQLRAAPRRLPVCPILRAWQVAFLLSDSFSGTRIYLG